MVDVLTFDLWCILWCIRLIHVLENTSACTRNLRNVGYLIHLATSLAYKIPGMVLLREVWQFSSSAHRGLGSIPLFFCFQAEDGIRDIRKMGTSQKGRHPKLTERPF